MHTQEDKNKMALKQVGCKRMKWIELAQDRILQQSCDHNNQPLDSIKGRDFIHYLMTTTSYRTLNREVMFQHTVQKMYLLPSYGTHKCTWPVHNYLKNGLSNITANINWCFYTYVTNFLLYKSSTLFQCQQRTQP
jgi:hypothetical protein